MTADPQNDLVVEPLLGRVPQLPRHRTADPHEAVLPAPVPLGSTSVHPVNGDQARDAVVTWAGGDRAHLVVTPNVDHLVLLEKDAGFRGAYAASSLRLCDGMPLLVLSRLAGTPLPQRVTGADLFTAVLRSAADQGQVVFVAGGAPDVLATGLRNLRAQHAGLRIDGWSPPMHFEGTEHDAELQRRITAADPDIVMVCFGAPRSEVWAAQQCERHPAVYLCVGAAIDFAAGTKRRAPAVLQRLGLEWAYRLVQEPVRLGRRYLVQDRAILGISLRHLHAAHRRRVIDLRHRPGDASVTAPRKRPARWAVVAAAMTSLLAVMVWLNPWDLPAGREEAGEITAEAPPAAAAPEDEAGPRDLLSGAADPLLWSGSFNPGTAGSWEVDAGVTVASRTESEVVTEGPEGRENVLRIDFGNAQGDESRWGVDYRHAFEALGLDDREEVYFSYDAYFSEDFEFIGDGKFGGLAGVSDGVDLLSASAGGSYDEDSFSVRAMWREDRSVVMYLYAAHADGREFDDPENYGFGIVEEFRNPDGSVGDTLQPGTWHRLEHRVKMNTPGSDDGVYELWIDGHRGISVDDVRYRTAQNPDLRINNLFSAWFFGGDPSQFPTRPNTAYTDDWALSSSYLGEPGRS